MIRHTKQSRRGLSTLEMVLSLPILLFIMALMINFGVAACWKVRSLTVARHAVWSTRWPRTGQSNPRPHYWPGGAGLTFEGAGNVPRLDDPRVDQPVARGPLPLGTTVHEELLDPTRGLRRGSASITQGFPMLGKMGTYHLSARTHLLDDKWQYRRMQWPEEGYRLGSNVQRRIPVIYALARVSEPIVQAHIQAAKAILGAAFRDQLAPLDRDEEYAYYQLLFGWGIGAPDFHPRLHRFCGLDPTDAAGKQQRLIDRIQGRPARPRVPSVAERMTRAFISLYGRAKREYESMDTTVMPPAEAAAVRAQIAQLEAKIQTLQEFLAVLRSNDGN